MSSSLALAPRRSIVQPGQYLDRYPEALADEGDVFERLLSQLECGRRGSAMSFRAFRARADEIERRIAERSTLDERERAEAVGRLSSRLASGLDDETLIDSFALVGLEIRRIFGFSPHREQYFCAWVLLHGMLAEMATGEGKSITAALAATVAGLAGAPVHVITTNDYLVERDAVSMRPLFERFGLGSGFVASNQDEEARRAAYANAICYVSNKQIVFDYLRDRQELGNRPSSISSRVRRLCRHDALEPLLRGLCFAIVDEADSVLIDDAITPLILSQQGQGKQDIAESLTAISLARRLTVGVDFNIDRRGRRVLVTERGEYQLATLGSSLKGVWKNRRYRLELARQALSAIHLFERDRDYLVRGGEVVLVDQSTGRVMPDRKLQHGLHQMVETKEKCELSGRSETISSLSFQSFFRRYRFLCGMTGTAREASAELRRVYRLGVVRVPTHRPSARVSHPPRFAVDELSHKQLLVEEIKRCSAAGRPVLVGTRSLAESERLSSCLSSESLEHEVLNARQDQREAEIVERAGTKGAITIATNMAGRGTDIPIDDDVRDLGGLQVIVAELNDNHRIDRQLIGRGARQGDPGSFVHIISLNDEMLQRHAPKMLLKVLRWRSLAEVSIWDRLCLWVCRQVQSQHERRQRRLRRQVALADQEMQRRLSFSGYKE